MSTATIIDGKKFSATLRGRIAEEVTRLKNDHNLTPGLAVVLVGEDPASQVYVRSKGKQTLEAGMNSYEHKMPAETTQEELLAKVEELNNDPAVHGILVQLPVPDHIDDHAIINAIDPNKDVDGFHVINSGRLATGARGASAPMIPCTPLGSIMLLKDHLGDLSGKTAVVVGRSNIVGKPMAQLLLQESCTVTIAHSRTKDLADVVRQADIVVAAVGRPEMVKGDWIKPGATVIDVGINRIEVDGKNKLVGDVATAEAMEHAGAITPVPGGVGPMTIACLLANTLTAASRQNGLEEPNLL
ncbi:methenyltetrahydrofolate cyclohydrolase [Kiloniella litopenaei]|uniref:Bifunctional protein FolD n=1 Tax=Kiloniella litopenaei TaxID=1549748 RepID=A0A0M2R923_9PROT|nr:bifunctional methylenetetrahydrofolate dehydrogenase/methenyltetrahydrofolate cyclohydrolase FolD [Kiloniella litopenaei]KKJ76083.1 methenyltetrahydrofolate cyclohydrolase [Kiloniella litopenaei]